MWLVSRYSQSFLKNRSSRHFNYSRSYLFISKEQSVRYRDNVGKRDLSGEIGQTFTKHYLTVYKKLSDKIML